MSENFIQLFNETLAQRSLYPGALVPAQVLQIDKDHIVVDAGLKSEAWIPRNQFLNEEGEIEVTIGDEVEVAIEALEDGLGHTRLSREKAKRAVAWDNLQSAFDTKATIQGTVTGKVKGGFTIDMGILQGFLPGSLVDIRPVRDFSSSFEGKKLDFKVIKLDFKRNNIVLSRQAVLESEGQVTRQLLLEQLYEGQIITGTVKKLTDYGAFIDLGGIDGLLHNSDIAWKQVRHPSEIEALTLDKVLEVMVLKVDREKSRISLGLKQLAGDPWNDLAERHPVGSHITGTVTKITDYGCFVEIEPGVEGLVHISEMDWTNRNVNPYKQVELGKQQTVEVLGIDVERRRISLGIKHCQANPWKLFASKYIRGDKVKGFIRSITDLGLFVGLEGGIDGLIHNSEIPNYTPSGEALRQFKKKDEIEAVILSVDPQRERVALSLKQLTHGHHHRRSFTSSSSKSFAQDHEESF